MNDPNRGFDLCVRLAPGAPPSWEAAGATDAPGIMRRAMARAAELPAGGWVGAFRGDKGLATYEKHADGSVEERVALGVEGVAREPQPSGTREGYGYTAGPALEADGLYVFTNSKGHRMTVGGRVAVGEGRDWRAFEYAGPTRGFWHHVKLDADPVWPAYTRLLAMSNLRSLFDVWIYYERGRGARADDAPARRRRARRALDRAIARAQRGWVRDGLAAIAEGRP
jgi:hypothetical protein